MSEIPKLSPYRHNENTARPSKKDNVAAGVEQDSRPADDNGRHIMSSVAGVISVFVLLYFFICSLDLLTSGFLLIGGRTAGSAFKSSLLRNPVCGLVAGLVFTAFLQSSSTSTSIIITMVAANLLSVRIAIPVIMGSNIGTSVTGILVAITQASERGHFRRAFSAASIPDMFNWLTVIVLLPLEIATGYLYHVTGAIVTSTSIVGGGEKQQFLKILTKPFTKLIVQIDKGLLGDIARGLPEAQNSSLLKQWCHSIPEPENSTQWTSDDSVSSLGIQNASKAYLQLGLRPTETMNTTSCRYLFHNTPFSEQAVGILLLAMSLCLLIMCLIFVVRLLKALIQGRIAAIFHRTINADLPGLLGRFTGYATMLLGVVLTVLVQSSSVVISVMTPLVGIGMVKLDRVYPLILGANIGTTSTAILASFAASEDRVSASLQIALCHLLFNLTGIVIWYPLPIFRRVPLRLARFLGRTMGHYRWFALVYLIVMFFVFPLAVFGLSMLGWYVLTAIALLLLALLANIAVINALQQLRPNWLPLALRSWKFLPLPLRSLAPLDGAIQRFLSLFACGRSLSENNTTTAHADDSVGCANPALDISDMEIPVEQVPGFDVAMVTFDGNLMKNGAHQIVF